MGWGCVRRAVARVKFVHFADKQLRNRGMLCLFMKPRFIRPRWSGMGVSGLGGGEFEEPGPVSPSAALAAYEACLRPGVLATRAGCWECV